MRHHLHAEVGGDAGPEMVWDILTDVDGHAGRGPSIVGARRGTAAGKGATR